MNEHQKQIIRKLRHFEYKKGALTVFCDAVEYLTINTVLAFDIANIARRRERLDAILKEYDGADAPVFHEVCSGIAQMLNGMPDNFGDYLGEIYMEIDAGKRHSGQFFTPMSVSRLIAKISFAKPDLEKPVITIGEPACGALSPSSSPGWLIRSKSGLMSSGLVTLADEVSHLPNL